MSIYFLVEGRRTESQIYPSWLEFLLPNFERVSSVNKVQDFGYFLISGNGYPEIKNRIFNSLRDIEEYPDFKNFVVILDTEEESIDDRKREIEEEIAKHKNNLEIFDLNTEVIVQKRCIETWLLGNPKIFNPNPQNKELLEYVNYYNVMEYDPELMDNYSDEFNHAKFHHRYLKLLLSEKNIRYTKRFPRDTKEKYFLKEIINRTKEKENHLETFQYMIGVMRELSQ